MTHGPATTPSGTRVHRKRAKLLPHYDAGHELKPMPNSVEPHPAPTKAVMQKGRAAEQARVDFVARLIRKFEDAEKMGNVTAMLAACDEMDAAGLGTLAKVYRRYAR
jgi:hypothetical protein